MQSQQSVLVVDDDPGVLDVVAFMLRREGKQFRRLLVDKLTGRDSDGRIEWGKMWKLAKMAAKMYLEK